MITLRIPTPLRPYAGGANEIQVNGETVGAALEELTNTYPTLRKHLYNEYGELRTFVNLYLNDEDIRQLQGTATRIKPGDRLMIIPSIAGGKGQVAQWK
jgi:molybdopterin converting factor small subunit